MKIVNRTLDGERNRNYMNQTIFALFAVSLTNKVPKRTFLFLSIDNENEKLIKGREKLRKTS